MKKILALAYLITCATITYAEDVAGIQFKHDLTFQQVLDLAKKENKIIFMDCYTTWCGPCKRLASEVFTNPEVGVTFNEKFINVKFDMEHDEGPAISTKYQIRAYPTLLWIDYNGVIKHKVVGGLSADGLIQAGQQASDPYTGQLDGMEKKWAMNYRDITYIEDYLRVLHGTRKDITTVYTEYMKLLKPEQMTKETTLKTVYEITDNINQPSINYLMQYKKQLTPLVTDAAYTQKINTIAQDAVKDAIKTTDEKAYNKATALVGFNKSKDAKRILAKMDMDYYLHTANVTVYDKYVSKYIQKYASKDEKILNDVAWQYYLNTNEPIYLIKARDWAYKAVNIKTCYTNNLSYAYLQYKMENYDEATKACDYAIIKAKEEGISAAAATSLQDFIKKETKKK
jgi:thiol-disulfide isomerase/thioredoxin